MKEEFDDKFEMAQEVGRDEYIINNGENPLDEAAETMSHVAGILSPEEKKSSHKALFIAIAIIVAIFGLFGVINFVSGNTIFGEPKHVDYTPLP